MTGTLKEFVTLRKKIKATEEEIVFWRARCGSPTSGSLEPKYNPNVNTESFQHLYVEKVMELEDQLAKEKVEYDKLYDKVLSTIMKLDNAEYKKFLVCKFIDEMPWNDIIKMMNYSERYLYKFQNKAIAAFDMIIK